MHFNLIDEKWIPVRRRDGSMETISPWQVTESFTDNPVAALNAVRPDFNGALIQFLIGLVQTTAAPADDDAWLGGVDGDAYAVRASFDIDVGYAGEVELLLEHVAKLVILDQVIGEILFTGIPLGAPVQDYANAGAVGIYLLTHSFSSYCAALTASSKTIVMWLVRLCSMSALPCERAQYLFRVGPWFA